MTITMTTVLNDRRHCAGGLSNLGLAGESARLMIA